jgi:protein-tyrosine phosphatase
MAMALLQEQVKDEKENWRIESAGIWAQSGNPAAVYTQLVLQNRGIQLKSHKSQPINRELVNQFNLVLTMEVGQKEALRAAFPDRAHWVYLITELDGGRFDVVDPIGGPLADYEDTARELEDILDNQLDLIRRLSEG